MKERSSNIELLRAVAMLMIVAYHIFCHCIDIQLTDVNSIAILGNGWYSYPGFVKRLCILAVISPMGQIGNAIFLIISGYFMAHKKSIDLTKISKKLLLQLGFAAIALGLFSIYEYRHVTSFSIDLLPFSAFNGMSWYIGYYFIVIVSAKVFLNRFLGNLTQKDYTMFLFVLFAFTQFSYTTAILSNLGNGLETVCTGIFLYSLGGYIKKYNPFESIRLWAIIAIIIFINLLVIGNFYIGTADQILAFNANSWGMFTQLIPKFANNSIVPVTLGIAIFELFRRIKIPNSQIINYIGASTFMVYLLHDNEVFYKIWGIHDWITLLHSDVVRFVITYLIVTLFTFMIGIVGYFLFEMLEKLFVICKPLIMKPAVKKEK